MRFTFLELPAAMGLIFASSFIKVSKLFGTIRRGERLRYFGTYKQKGIPEEGVSPCAIVRVNLLEQNKKSYIHERKGLVALVRAPVE